MHQIIITFCHKISEDEVGDLNSAIHQPHAVEVICVTIRVTWGRDSSTSIFIYASAICV